MRTIQVLSDERPSKAAEALQDPGPRLAHDLDAYALGIGQTHAHRLSGPVWATFGSAPGFGSTRSSAHKGRDRRRNHDDSTQVTEAIAEVPIETATEGR